LEGVPGIGLNQKDLDRSSLPLLLTPLTSGVNMSIEDFTQALKTASSTRTAAIIGIIAVIGVPFAMIAFGGSEASKVPWFIWVLVSLVLVLVIGAGYYLFTRTHDGKDISIRPNSR
jgi:drug/metabolite transporter (DMT)-like permease